MLLLNEHWPLFGTQPSLRALRSTRSIHMRWVPPLCVRSMRLPLCFHMNKIHSLHLATAVDLAEGPRPHHEEVGEIVVQARKRNAVCV